MAYYDISGVPSFGYSENDLTSFFSDKMSYDELTNATSPQIRVPASDQSHDQFTSENITSFVKDIVGGLAGFYTAKASVDVARVKAQTALDVAKVQGIYPKAGGQIYDSSSMTQLFVLGSLAVGVFFLVRK